MKNKDKDKLFFKRDNDWHSVVLRSGDMYLAAKYSYFHLYANHSLDAMKILY